MSGKITYKNRPYYYWAHGVYVNNWGLGAVKYVKERQFGITVPKAIPYHVGKDGFKYIQIGYTRYRLDAILAELFIPKPDNFWAYVIEYIDGDKSNCKVDNLRWVPAPQIFDKKTGMKKVCIDVKSDTWIYEDGQVYIKGVKESMKTEGFDGDTDLFYVLDFPRVRTNPSSTSTQYVEVLMRAARFVEGDYYALNNPGIIHVDGDYLNFKSSNLLWVERTDPRYTDYCRKRDFDVQAKEDELNLGKRHPGNDRTAKWKTN